MQTYKINYTIKNTKSNNTYVELNRRDHDIFIQTIMSLNSYLQELCLSSDMDIRQIASWYRSTDKKYPYNKRLQKRNSPESMLSGLINNMIFGTQINLSLDQLPYYEEIINTGIDLIQSIETVKNIQLQTSPAMTKIVFGLGI